MSDSEPNTPIDWATFFESPPPKPDWLVFPLVQRGQHALLFSETKAGKSLLTLDLLSRACNGVQLDDSETSPMRVLYLDFENSQDDLRLRLDSLQASAKGLTGLVYISFPSLPPLDTWEGGKELLNLVTKHKVDLVVIDTISRAVEGQENDAMTWHALYRHSLMRLQRLRVATLRLDHSGNRESAGPRGSTAKTSDVDAVWRLKHEKPGRRRTLKRTFTRRGVGPDEIVLSEQAAPLLHVLLEAKGDDQDKVEQLCAQLDRLGVAPGAGRPTVAKALKEAGIRASTTTLAQVVKTRNGSASIS